MLHSSVSLHTPYTTRWMQIIQQFQYPFYHRINGSKLMILVHWNNNLLCSLTAVGVCCWLQSCLNKLDGVLIDQRRLTMLSQEINRYGAFEMRHIGEALKKPCSHGTRLWQCRHAESLKMQVIPLLWVWQQEIIKKLSLFADKNKLSITSKKKQKNNISSWLWISGLNTSMLVNVQRLEPSLNSNWSREWKCHYSKRQSFFSVPRLNPSSRVTAFKRKAESVLSVAAQVSVKASILQIKNFNSKDQSTSEEKTLLSLDSRLPGSRISYKGRARSNGKSEQCWESYSSMTKSALSFSFSYKTNLIFF